MWCLSWPGLPMCVCISYSVVSDSCDPKDCSPLGCSVHGILQANILERVAIPFSRGSSQPKNQPAYIAGRFFTTWATREAHRLTHIHSCSNFLAPEALLYGASLPKEDWLQRSVAVELPCKPRTFSVMLGGRFCSQTGLFKTLAWLCDFGQRLLRLS